jgi:hypothetical protein
MDFAYSSSEANLADKLLVNLDETIALDSEHSASSPAMIPAATDLVALSSTEGSRTNSEFISRHQSWHPSLLPASPMASTQAQLSRLRSVRDVEQAEPQSKASTSTPETSEPQRCAVDAGIRLAGQGAAHDLPWVGDDQSSVRSVLPPPYAAYR